MMIVIGLLLILLMFGLLIGRKASLFLICCFVIYCMEYDGHGPIGVFVHSLSH